MYTTRLEVGAFVDIEISVPEESRKPSSFFIHRSSKIKPQRPFGSTIIHQFKIKPRRPLKKVFFVLRSSFFQDQAPTALEELPPIQDQASTALEESVHRSSTVHPKIKPQRPFGSTTSTNPHIQPFFEIKPKSP
ncbi:hypothetical protein TB1_028153 [Malus domestica]